MLRLENPSVGLLFSSFLYRHDLHSLEALTQFWEEKYGKSVRLVPACNPLIQYYAKEMGENLSRVFFMTTKTFPREFLLSTKLESLQWEQSWAVNNQRRVNVDIGFLSPENFLLATTKNYSHRVFIGQKIFADLTYYYHHGELRSFPWTYPDYLDEEKKSFFTWCRALLLQLKNT